MTKKYKKLYGLFNFLSLLSIWGPIIFFIAVGAANGEITTKSVWTLGSTAVTAIFLMLLSLILKKHWITPSIIILICLVLITEHFKVVLLTIGICIMLDELIFTPLRLKYKNLFIINKQIDKRTNGQTC